MLESESKVVTKMEIAVSLLSFNFSNQSFVRESENSRIPEEIKINFKMTFKAIWFLQWEFFEHTASNNVSVNFILYQFHHFI